MNGSFVAGTSASSPGVPRHIPTYVLHTSRCVETFLTRTERFINIKSLERGYVGNGGNAIGGFRNAEGRGHLKGVKKRRKE